MEKAGEEAELRKYMLFRSLIRTTEIAIRLCSLAWIGECPYDYVMLILLDRFRIEKTAKKVYNKLKSIGFLAETIEKDVYLGPELQNPLKSRKFRKVLKKFGIQSLDEITPDIAKQITGRTDYVVVIENGQVKVFPKLDVIKVKLTEEAQRVCEEETSRNEFI